jgi:hypothetical protein
MTIFMIPRNLIFFFFNYKIRKRFAKKFSKNFKKIRHILSKLKTVSDFCRMKKYIFL